MRIAFGPVGLAGVVALVYGLWRRRPLLILLGAAAIARDPKGPFRRR